MSSKTLSPRGNANATHIRSFSKFFSPWSDWLDRPAWEHATTMPPVNIKEKTKSYRLSLAAPGLKKQDFRIIANGNILTISADKKNKATEKPASGIARDEYNYSSFSRSFTLPHDIKDGEIRAKYKDGELQLTFTKQKSMDSAPARIAVK